MKKIISFLTLLVCLFLVGCDGSNHKTHPQIDYSDANYKELIQAKLDRANPSGAKGICFSIDGRLYPYISTYTSLTVSKPSDYVYIVHNGLNQRLHLFAQIGLLSEEPMADNRGQPIHRYDLTDLGKQYYYYYDGIIDGFCFGKANVIRLVQPPSFLIKEGKWFKNVYFEYEIDNIPNWVTENKPLLSQVYDDILPPLEKKQATYHILFKRPYNKSSNTKDREWYIPEGSLITSSLFLKFEKGWLD